MRQGEGGREKKRSEEWRGGKQGAKKDGELGPLVGAGRLNRQD